MLIVWCYTDRIVGVLLGYLRGVLEAKACGKTATGSRGVCKKEVELVHNVDGTFPRSGIVRLLDVDGGGM